MNEILIKNLNILKTAGKKMVRYVLYCHFLLFILILIWVYFFSRSYFLRPKKDIEFIKDHIADVTYTQLKTDEFIEVYQAYRDKINYHVDMPPDLKILFKQ